MIRVPLLILGTDRMIDDRIKSHDKLEVEPQESMQERGCRFVLENELYFPRKPSEAPP